MGKIFYCRELQHFEKVVDKRYSGAIQYDQVEKLSTHKIRQDVFRKEDVLPSPHKDSIPADFVSAGFLFVHDNRMLADAIKKIREDAYAVLPLAVMLGFCVAGLVEWLFHPCNPLGFSAMALLAPLMSFSPRRHAA